MVAVVYRSCGLRIDYVCDGPDAAGQCPFASEGRPVPCAGRKVTLSRDELAVAPQFSLYRPSYRVPVGAKDCPLFSMEPETVGPLSLPCAYPPNLPLPRTAPGPDPARERAVA